MVASPLAPLSGIIGNQLSTLEFDLADSLSGLGYLVAVGKPGEEIPEIGFDRRYFANDEWQTQVKMIMELSAMIIYRPDSTDGVIWEYEQIKLGNHKSKVLIWTQMGDDVNNELQKVRYNIFRKKVFDKFGDTMPMFSRLNKFIFCNSNGQWESVFSPGKTPIFKYVKQNA